MTTRTFERLFWGRLRLINLWCLSFTARCWTSKIW